MAVTNYMTVNGKIRSEHRSGEAHARDYMHDPSGNVIGVYVNGWLNGDACYTPWGGTLASWNMDSSYKFMWMGGWGYRQTNLEWSSTYVRARHYSHRDGAWTTRDPLWPDEMAYGYVDGRVLAASDPSGEKVKLKVVIENCGDKNDNRYLALKAIIKRLEALIDKANDPLSNTMNPFLDCIAPCKSNASGAGKSGVDVCLAEFLEGRREFKLWCQRSQKGTAIASRGYPIDTTIDLWPKYFNLQGIPTNDMACILIHELMHNCGAGHASDTDVFFECIRQHFPCPTVGARSLTTRSGTIIPIGNKGKKYD